MATTATRDGITLYYEVNGSGPPIVLIHGFLCDGSLFNYQVPALARTHRVINIDLRGHGRSGPSGSPYTIYDKVLLRGRNYEQAAIQLGSICRRSHEQYELLDLRSRIGGSAIP